MPDNPKNRKFSFRIFFIALLAISFWAILSRFAAGGHDQWMLPPDSLFGVMAANALFWTFLAERIIVIICAMNNARQQRNIQRVVRVIQDIQ